MKKVLIIIIMIIPNYSGISYNNNDHDLIEIQKNELQLLLNLNSINNEINYEYQKFYEIQSFYSNKRHINFINNIVCHAMKSKSLPSISIAQAILETGYGKYNKLGYNLFGIKGNDIKSKTKEFVNGKYISIYSKFQNFNNFDDAFIRHYDIIKKYKFDNNNYADWANKIQSCGYATDPNYSKKLIHIIEKHELFRLDKIQALNNEYYMLNC